jgi:phospholipid/cholesterol/gamma-HCH transport system substrate-binding protein
MIVRREVQQFIKADSEVAIGSEGLIGDRLLIITQGSSDAPIVAEGQELVSKEPVETDAIIASLEVTSGHVEVITKQLAEIMIGINKGEGTLGLLLQDTTTANNIDQTIANFKKSSEGLDETIEITKDNVFAFMVSLKETAAKTEVASQQLGEIMTRINKGEGALGMLLMDTVIVNNIDETIINLKESSIGLNENMEALKHNFLFRRYFRKQAKKEALEEAKDEKDEDQETELQE